MARTLTYYYAGLTVFLALCVAGNSTLEEINPNKTRRISSKARMEKADLKFERSLIRVKAMKQIDPERKGFRAFNKLVSPYTVNLTEERGLDHYRLRNVRYLNREPDEDYDELGRIERFDTVDDRLEILDKKNKYFEAIINSRGSTTERDPTLYGLYHNKQGRWARFIYWGAKNETDELLCEKYINETEETHEKIFRRFQYINRGCNITRVEALCTLPGMQRAGYAKIGRGGTGSHGVVIYLRVRPGWRLEYRIRIWGYRVPYEPNATAAPSLQDLEPSNTTLHQDLGTSNTPLQHDLVTANTPLQQTLRISFSTSHHNLGTSNTPWHQDFVTSNTPSHRDLRISNTTSHRELGTSNTTSTQELGTSVTPSNQTSDTFATPSFHGMQLEFNFSVSLTFPSFDKNRQTTVPTFGDERDLYPSFQKYGIRDSYSKIPRFSRNRGSFESPERKFVERKFGPPEGFPQRQFGPPGGFPERTLGPPKPIPTPSSSTNVTVKRSKKFGHILPPPPSDYGSSISVGSFVFE